MDELTRLTNDSICALPRRQHHHTPRSLVYRGNSYQFQKKEKRKNNLCTAGELICATTNNAHACRHNNNGIFIINYMIRCSECSNGTQTEDPHRRFVWDDEKGRVTCVNAYTPCVLQQLQATWCRFVFFILRSLSLSRFYSRAVACSTYAPTNNVIWNV